MAQRHGKRAGSPQNESASCVAPFAFVALTTGQISANLVLGGSGGARKGTITAFFAMRLLAIDNAPIRGIIKAALRQMNVGFKPCVQVVDPLESSLFEGCIFSSVNGLESLYHSPYGLRRVSSISMIKR